MTRPDLHAVDPDDRSAPDRSDDLAAARGIVTGLIIGMALWGLIAAALVAAGRFGWLP